jgi:hypothetical protein
MVIWIYPEIHHKYVGYRKELCVTKKNIMARRALTGFAREIARQMSKIKCFYSKISRAFRKNL